MTSTKILLQPLIEPITIDEIKTYARIDSDSENDLLTGLIVAARQWAENYTGRAFITQKWQFCIDNCPNYNFQLLLPRSPLQSVVAVKTYFDNDNITVLSEDSYFVDNISEPGRVVLKNDYMMPIAEAGINGVMIEYICGYGDDKDAVPEIIKLAIKQLAAFWYEHRGEVAVDNLSNNIPSVIYSLLNAYRIRRLGPT